MRQNAALRALLRAHPGREFTQREIAEEVGVTRQAVGEIERRAMRKIRRWAKEAIREHGDV